MAHFFPECEENNSCICDTYKESSNKMAENNVEHSDAQIAFKITDLFRLYKAASELVHAEETPDLEAKVKFVDVSGTEFLITELRLELNPETEEQIVWLSGVIDE